MLQSALAGRGLNPRQRGVCPGGARQERHPRDRAMSASANFGHTQPLAAVPPVAKSKLAKLGNVRPVLKTGVATAAVLLLAVPLMTLAADARGGGFGGGHGGFGGGGHIGGFGGGGHIGGFGGGHFGGFGGGRIGGFGGARIGSFGGHVGGSVGASAEWVLRAAAQDREPAPSVSAAESVRSRAAGSPDAPLPASAPVCRWRGCPAADLQPPRPGTSGGRRYAR